jgi:hypothetical protein
VTVAVNGLAALSLVDAQHSVTARGHPTGTLSFHTSRARHIVDLPIGGALPDGALTHSVKTHSVKRRDRYRALNDEAARRAL